MDKWFIPLFRMALPSVDWYGPDSSVYLTFDDGPHPTATPAVLDILRQEKIKAHFFLIGQHARRYPEIVQEIQKDGHVIGNHTMTHHRIWFSSRERLDAEIGGTQLILEEMTGHKPGLFRPPYNRIDPVSAAYVRRAGLRTVMFSVNTWDFLGHPVQRVARRVARRIRPGDIVAFHDNQKTHHLIGAYLSRVVEVIRSKSLRFDTLPT